MSGNACGVTDTVGKYIISLDVGTTTLKCCIYNESARVVGLSSKKIEFIENKVQGWFELDEDLVFSQSVLAIREALTNANLRSDSIDCLGITTQRNTFITWDRDTGVPFHHLITWQDLRASRYVNNWNKCFKLKLFNGFFKLLHLITRKKHFLAAGMLKFKSAQVILRLKWMLENNPRLKERVAEEKVCFGTLDTWLLWKLSGEMMHATDYSNASSTAMFDPFQMTWSRVICKLVGIPMHILPPILDTSGYFGCCDKKLFGIKIPIRTLVADQQSSMFGQCRFKEGDIKCTLGTGTFIDCNMGSNLHTSMQGFYPLVGWKIGCECVYITEGFASNTGQALEWAKSIGFINSFEELEMMVSKSLASTSKSSDLCFVPAFNGFQMPINDDEATALLIGMTLDTTKEDIVRSILCSIAFRFHLLQSCLFDEMRGRKLSSTILCDGGVSNNKFLLQVMSRLAGKHLKKSANVNATLLGAAYLAGMASGIWKDKEELLKLHERNENLQLLHGDLKGSNGDCDFDADFETSNQNILSYLDNALFTEYSKWLKAIERCKAWRSC